MRMLDTFWLLFAVGSIVYVIYHGNNFMKKKLDAFETCVERLDARLDVAECVSYIMEGGELW